MNASSIHAMIFKKNAWTDRRQINRTDKETEHQHMELSTAMARGMYEMRVRSCLQPMDIFNSLIDFKTNFLNTFPNYPSNFIEMITARVESYEMAKPSEVQDK